MKFWGAALIVPALVATAGAAQAQDDMAAKFGQRERVRQVSISPDGERLAVIQPTKGAGSVVSVITIATGDSKPVLSAKGGDEQIGRCDWALATRLVCSVHVINRGTTGLQGFSRLFALDADGQNMQMLSDKTRVRAFGASQFGGGVIDWSDAEESGRVLMTRYQSGEYQTGSLLGRSASGLAVDAVDTVSLKRRTVESPKDGVVDYISDGRGHVRMMISQTETADGYSGNTYNISYRKANSRDWESFGTYVSEAGLGTGFLPVAVDPNLDVVYGFDSLNGRSALYSVSLDGKMTKALVYANDHVDVDGLVSIGRSGRVVGAQFVTDKRQTVFFDPALKSLGTALANALPNHPLISFVDSTADEQKLVLWVGSDVDPGGYYLFDKSTKQLAEIMKMRPQLDPAKLATVKSVHYKSRDGVDIPAYLTLPAGSDGKGLPAIVMPHGGPGSRDEWGFDWLSQYFAARGYAVLQPNFRGSTGYGSGWFQKNGFQSWPTAIGDVDDGGKWLVSSGIAAPGKLGIVGWSYGGYAALQSGVYEPGLFKAIVAIAPVTDLEQLREDSRYYTNFRQVEAFIGRGDHVKTGSPAQNAEKITVPVMLFHGDYDQNVDVGQSRLMASRLRSAGKTVEYTEFPGLDHQLADSDVRTRMLGDADKFLRAAMGQ